MLEIVEYNKDEYAFPSLLVLGCFDAIHVGHRELFKKAKLQAKINGLDLGVMMFREGKGGKQVYSFDERLKMLEGYNVKFVLVIDYTPEFMSTAAIDFLTNIEDKINVKAYMSGKDFRFGKGQKGKSATLKKYAEDEENGVWYMPVKEVTEDGEKISTSMIKSLLDLGDVAKAGKLLASPFFVEGEVVKGAGRGTSYGFPTANIEYPDWKYPVRYGVYKAKADIDGTAFFGIANYGTCPTFDDGRIALEVHFNGFEGDLYGKTLKVELLGYIRDIVKFDSDQALAAQLEQDKASLELSDEEFAAAHAVAHKAEEAQAVEQPAEVSAEPVKEQPVKEVVVEAIEPVVEQPVEEVAEAEAEPAEEQPAEEIAEVEAEPVEEQPVEAVVEAEAEPVEEQPAEEVAEVEAEPVEEQPAEEVAEAEAEPVEEQPVEEVAEAEAEPVEEQPAEEIAEVGAEPAEEQPAEEIAEVEAESVEEQPVEEIAEAEAEPVEEQPAEEVAEDIVGDFAEEIPDEGVDEILKELSDDLAEDSEDIDLTIFDESAETDETADAQDAQDGEVALADEKEEE